MASSAQGVGPEEESVRRRVCGDALEEGACLLDLLRVVYPWLCDGERLVIICKAFGWQDDTSRSALLAEYVSCRDKGGEAVAPGDLG